MKTLWMAIGFVALLIGAPSLEAQCAPGLLPATICVPGHAYRETVEDAHRLRRLQQNYVNANGHCQFSNSEVLASFQALLSWVETHKRPTREEIADLCQRNTLVFGDTCNFNLEFQPRAFDTRCRIASPMKKTRTPDLCGSCGPVAASTGVLK